MKKHSIASIFLGIYLILLGLLWLGHTASSVSTEEFKEMQYEGHKSHLAMFREAREEYEFKSEAQQKEFDRAYDNMAGYVERSDPKKNKHFPLLNWIITTFIIVTAVAYVFSGVLLLRGFKRFRFYFRAGQYGFIVTYLLWVFASLSSFLMPSMADYSNKVMKVLYPDESLGGSLEFLISVAPYILIWFGLSFGLYVILPKVIIRRSEVIQELLKKETVVHPSP